MLMCTASQLTATRLLHLLHAYNDSHFPCLRVFLVKKKKKASLLM